MVPLAFLLRATTAIDLDRFSNLLLIPNDRLNVSVDLYLLLVFFYHPRRDLKVLHLRLNLFDIISIYPHSEALLRGSTSRILPC